MYLGSLQCIMWARIHTYDLFNICIVVTKMRIVMFLSDSKSHGEFNVDNTNNDASMKNNVLVPANSSHVTKTVVHESPFSRRMSSSCCRLTRHKVMAPY